MNKVKFVFNHFALQNDNLYDVLALVNRLLCEYPQLLIPGGWSEYFRIDKFKDELAVPFLSLL